MILLATASLFWSCTSSDEPSPVKPPEPVTIHWSLSGTFGNAQIDSVSEDTELPGMVNRSGTSTVNLNGFDTTYFKNQIILTHLQFSTSATVDIDDDGSFTFDNMEVFGIRDGTNSIRISPEAKENVVLQPNSFILYSNR